MITSNFQVDGDIYSYADRFFCDSHDDKPSNADARDGLINGAILEETDTGKTYIFDKKANKWTEKAGGGGGGSTTLAGLTDVDISNPSDGQTLVYDATAGKWKNGEASGITEVIAERSTNPDTEQVEITLNMTPAALYDLCPSAYIKYQFTTLGGSVQEVKHGFVNARVETDQGDLFYTFRFSDGLVANPEGGDNNVVFTLEA